VVAFGFFNIAYQNSANFLRINITEMFIHTERQTTFKQFTHGAMKV